MADIPAQPCTRHRGDRSLPGSTLTFECLFAFLVLGHGRRQLLWFAVTRHPTAEWLAQQIVEAFPWGTAPPYLVRDNDGAYGQAFTSRVRAMGIRDRPISPRSPWQNPYAERLIGTLRRECLDHVLIFGERHLRRVLSLYSLYYNETRTHLGLAKDAPLRRAVQRSGNIVTTPILSGLASSIRADMIFGKDRCYSLPGHGFISSRIRRDPVWLRRLVVRAGPRLARLTAIAAAGARQPSLFAEPAP